jgi:predicted DCC family thiol-disulfide oxidoreductase YuxK
MRVPNPPAKPLLVYDGDCGFCRTWVARWRRTVGPRVDYEEFQTAGARFPTIQRSRFRRALQLILPDGDIFEGAEAVFRTLALAPGRPRQRRWLAVYQNVPGARPVFEWGYRWVADHRPLLTRVSHFFFGPPADALPTGGNIGDVGGSGDMGDGEHSSARARELAAARRRRIAVGAGLGAVLLLGGVAAWRRRARRLASGSEEGDQGEK